MSIASEITRLQGVKSNILHAISDKGVTVPVGSKLDDVPGLIAQIPYGSNVIGGKAYKTVRMPDGKVWLAENLDYKFLNIGGSWRPHDAEAMAWYYDNDESTYGWNGYKCGLLYNWYAVKFLNDNRADLCPGWHVPTKSEVENLINACGGPSIACSKLKSVDRSWFSGWGGTNDYGFNMLPAGDYWGTFSDIGSIGLLRLFSETSSDKAYNYYFTQQSCGSEDILKEFAYSVRLVKDS